MKYYVITAGEYSGYHIIGVTSDKSKAEKCVENYKRINCYAEWGGEEIQIEEFDDVHGNFYCSEFADSNSMYRVTKTIKRYIDGKTNTFYDCGNMMLLGQNKPRDFAGRVRCHRDLEHHPIVFTYWVDVWAKNEENARKIGADRIAKKQAEVEIDGVFDAQEGEK